jgi:hypothetical protein
MRRFSPVLAAVLVATNQAAAAQSIPDHGAFTEVLRRHLHGSLVDYAALQGDREGLDAYLAALNGADPDTVMAAARDVRLAFWINAYNACALRLVIDHYPVKKRGFPASVISGLRGVPSNSIRQIPDTWNRAFCEVAGTARSLDEIEHEIIRPIGEPRIHFAVNCASRSCPVLAPEAYMAGALAVQLDAAVARFVADSTHFLLDRSREPTLRLNKLLDWYKDDFGGTEGVVRFFIPFVSPEEAAVLESGSVRVKHFDYDWTLNDVAVFGSPER